MDIIKIVKLCRKNFRESYEIRRYRMKICNQLVVSHYSMNVQKLKINEKE